MNAMNIPKLCGGDIELGNFITGAEALDGTGNRAALALLGKIRGVSSDSRQTVAACDCSECRTRADEQWQSGAYGTTSGSTVHGSYNPQDWMRTYLPGNGGCVYIDLDHLEICLPEVLSARDHVAAWNAMLRIAARAQASANADLPAGQRLHVLANNTDGHGSSFGSHLDFLITRRAWENIFNRRLQYLLYLAAYQVSSIVFTGQGKVGSEGLLGGATPCDYQVSQRADFIEVLMGVQTTYNRPIVNSRDEALCGLGRTDRESPASHMARLHVIFYDSTLCHVASLLKVGVMQIMLAMIEAEKMNPELILDDPVGAVGTWSRDPQLTAHAKLASGKEITAVELQFRFLEEAKAFVDAGGCEGIVPDAEMIMDLWADTLTKLHARDFTALAPRLDWVLKLSLLERAMKQRPELTWDSPEIKHLDHLYSALDGGLYQVCERQGAVERVVSGEQIARFINEPPEDTRAYTRSRLLRIAGPDRIDHVDWDEITFKLKTGWPDRRTVRLANPLGFTKAKTHFLETASLDDALDILGAEPAVSFAPAVAAPDVRSYRYPSYRSKPSNPHP
jgi:proteasome accessory factor A